jgi:hypothetical protein
MIAPQPGTPGSIGQQHGLTRLTAALESIEAGQRAQQTRDMQTQTQRATQAAALAQMGLKLHWLSRILGVLAVLTLALGGLVGWQLTHPPEMVYAKALGAVDSTLMQTWGTLPKTAQEALTATYSRLGLASPGDRPLPRKVSR